jgi:superfamily II DNA/RNA helicase
MPESFSDVAELPEDVLSAIRDLGWDEPMPVQSRVIPLMSKGRDLIVAARRAPSGSPS